MATTGEPQLKRQKLDTEVKQAEPEPGSVFSSWKLETGDFVTLLEKLVAETPHLMNKPPQYVPQEALAARHVLEILMPLSREAGGPLDVKEIQYKAGRSNIIIKYRGATQKTCSFVGSHLDVVHADPATWNRDPFKLSVEGDILHGRGTTDCLGHVALLTNLFYQLGVKKPRLQRTIIGVIIADEEAGGSDEQVGVEGLMARGELGDLKNGPVYWLDCADAMPNIGSGGVVQWSLTAKGKMFHSGFPNKAVNAIELAQTALRHIQERFYQQFPTHLREAVYGFPCSSSLKPTNVSLPPSSLNQIRGECTIEGDIRLVPFYKIKDAMAFVDSVVEELNSSRFAQLSTVGPSPFHLEEKDHTFGSINVRWHSNGIDGLACDLESDGFRCLVAATEAVFGRCTPLADTGSLPLVADLQAAGCDVQTVGYGVEDAYHADNEFARLSDFEKGFQVLTRVIADLEEK